MLLFLHSVLIVILSFVLGRASDAVAGSVHRIGRAYRVGDFALAFVLLGLATSMPEISVALFSATRGVPSLSLGNLMGANVVVLSLLTGLAAIAAGKLKIGQFFHGNIFPLFILTVAAPGLAVLDGRVTRLEGVLLIAAYAAFLMRFYSQRRQFRHLRHTKEGANFRMRNEAMHLAAAILTLLIASYFLVQSALFVAAAIGLPPLVVGLLMLSIGTNLPELSFVITQAIKGKSTDVLLGDLFGSVLVNTPTLGLLALLTPFSIDQPGKALVVSLFMAVLLGLFAVFSWTKKEISRTEGIILVAFYGLFLLENIGVFGS